MSEAECDERAPSVRLVEVGRQFSGSCGFHLTRSKWDPYPWVSRVDIGSAAYLAGMKTGDCILEVNGEDVLGHKISDVADLVRANSDHVSFLLWNAGVGSKCDPESLCCGPMPTNLQRLSACMSAILVALECPVCLDTIQPPTYQCTYGHLVCARCHDKSQRCPICRVRLPRGLSREKSLFADQVYNSLLEAFEIPKDQNERAKSDKIKKIFRLKNKKKCTPNIKVMQSHTGKLLAQLTEKSSSAENLSNQFLVSKNLLSVRQDFSRLKTKSLSATEIFRSSSRPSSRPGSPFLTRSASRPQGMDNGDVKSNLSCHSSYEFLNKCMQGERSTPDELYHCPFAEHCDVLIKANSVMHHFQEAHDGPLVQYFRPKVRFAFADCHDHTYCFQTNEQRFFLKIYVRTTDKDSTNVFEDVRVWMWVLSTEETANLQLQLNIRSRSNADHVLLSVDSPIYSLATTSWADIINSQKGVYLSFKTLDSLSNCCLNNLILDIEIKDRYQL